MQHMAVTNLKNSVNLIKYEGLTGWKMKDDCQSYSSSNGKSNWLSQRLSSKCLNSGALSGKSTFGASLRHASESEKVEASGGLTTEKSMLFTGNSLVGATPTNSWDGFVRAPPLSVWWFCWVVVGRIFWSLVYEDKLWLASYFAWNCSIL